MNLANTVGAGLREIWAHKFRSALTMLGIILGVSSLVAMSALVTGMERGAREALLAIGGIEKIRIEPAQVPPRQIHLADQAVGITMNDVAALSHNAPLARLLSPEMRLDGATVSAGDERVRPFIVAGVWPVAMQINEHELAHGRMFNEIDEETANNVCIIGTGIRDELFGDPEETGTEVVPLGRTLLINGLPFTVIGMFQHYESEQRRLARERERARGGNTPAAAAPGPKRRRGWGGPGTHFIFWLKNSTVYMPLNTMWMRFRSAYAPPSARAGGATSIIRARAASTDATPVVIPDPRLSVLEIKIADADRLDPAIQQVRNVLMATHRGIEDFSFRTQEEFADRVREYVRNARVSGGIIAGISLLVGGIGIMNIMLASITGRIREIGIRKAVGAGTLDIFVQVLIESVVLAVLGGFAGLGAAFALVALIGGLSAGANAPVVTAAALATAFSASVATGIAAGLFPALKAARLNPIAALRYE